MTMTKVKSELFIQLLVKSYFIVQIVFLTALLTPHLNPSEDITLQLALGSLLCLKWCYFSDIFICLQPR